MRWLRFEQKSRGKVGVSSQQSQNSLVEEIRARAAESFEYLAVQADEESCANNNCGKENDPGTNSF
jgi:hypothetical protein